MKIPKSNASDKSVNTPILSENSSNTCDQPDDKVDKKLPRWNWRKVARTIKDVTSVASVIMSLVQILQELGLLP